MQNDLCTSEALGVLERKRKWKRERMKERMREREIERKKYPVYLVGRESHGMYESSRNTIHSN